MRKEKVSRPASIRVRLYRDPFNDLLVFTLSAAGAVAGAPAIRLVLGAVLGQLGPNVIVGASVLPERLSSFVVGHAQMTPRQSLGWDVLWETIAAAKALFYHPVVDPLSAVERQRI